MIKIILIGIKKKLNDMKLRNKLFVSFVFVVFIPVIIVGGYLTNELRQFALDDTVKQNTENMERVKKRTLEVLKVPIYLSNNLQFDQHLKKIVNTDFNTIYDVVDAYRDYNTFYNYRRIYSEIFNIRFYMENETLLNNWEIIPPDQQVQESFWYTTAKAGKGLSSWYYIEDETNNYQKYLSLVRRIDFLDFKTNGVLVINVNAQSLNLILSQESAPTMILDDQNYVIATNQSDDIGKKINEIANSKEVMEGQTGIFQGIVEGEPSQIFIDDIPLENSLNKLRIVSLISDESIVENANRFRRMGIIVVAISVCVALLLIYYFSKLLSNRLYILSEQINQVGKGNFNTPMLIDGNDEIGRLSKQLELTVTNTRQLLDEVHESNRQKTLLERKQNEIKFKMMASQINPHFLFNSLESIRMKAHLHGEKEISHVVKLLGKLMRNSIEVGTGKVTLKSEVDVVRCYLEIQKFRYGDRLSYELNINPSYHDISIPPLIIQPLVENAVIHGLEDKESGGEVYVETKRTGGGVLVEVIDNGIGISKEKREEIYKLLNEREEKEGTRIGLRNVHQRLQLSYGTTYGLTVNSEVDSGTKVSFLIPIGEEYDV